MSEQFAPPTCHVTGTASAAVSWQSQSERSHLTDVPECLKCARRDVPEGAASAEAQSVLMGTRRSPRVNSSLTGVHPALPPHALGALFPESALAMGALDSSMKSLPVG